MKFTSNKNSENPGKASSSESNTEKVIPYEQGNIITSNNAYSANETINIKKFSLKFILNSDLSITFTKLASQPTYTWLMRDFNITLLEVSL